MDYYYYDAMISVASSAKMLGDFGNGKTCLGRHILLQEEASKLAFGDVNTCDHCNLERINESSEALCITIFKPAFSISSTKSYS